MIFTLRQFEPVDKNNQITWDECLVYQSALFEKFFQSRVLVLSDYDINGLDLIQWIEFVDRVAQFVNANCIDTILINATLNPIDTSRKPDPVQMQQDLSAIVTSYFITPDFAYWYNPTPGFIFFPFLIWIFATKNIDQYFNTDTVWADPFSTSTVYDAPLEKTRALMCLNRNLQWHRIYLFSLLADYPWFNNIDYSFMNVLDSNVYSSFVVNKNLSATELENVRSHQHLLPIKLAEEKNIANHLIPIQYMRGAGSVAGDAYASCAINLVTETSLTEGVLLTEKTAKPFMAYQIPILVGPVGANQFLENIGLDMFGDYIPWKTWDHVKDHKLKINMIVEFLDSVLSGPTAEQDILLTHQSFKLRLLKNKQYFHSTEFENILLKQLRPCTN